MSEISFISVPIESSFIYELIPADEHIIISDMFKLKNLTSEYNTHVVITENGLYYNYNFFNHLFPAYIDLYNVKIGNIKRSLEIKIKGGPLPVYFWSLLQITEHIRSGLKQLNKELNKTLKNFQQKRIEYWRKLCPNERKRRKIVNEHTIRINSIFKKRQNMFILKVIKPQIEKEVLNNDKINFIAYSEVWRSIDKTLSVSWFTCVLITNIGILFIDDYGKIMFKDWKKLKIQYLIRWYITLDYSAWLEDHYSFHILNLYDENMNEIDSSVDVIEEKLKHISILGKQFWNNNFPSKNEYKTQIRIIKEILEDKRIFLPR
ncbi:MAG: hypothetical protein EAX96_20500 [Candidatus Lokiarchaeota archaeon]|nr:hypothetical protein [Candidatus Lokiarchaeota archaeon]